LGNTEEKDMRGTGQAGQREVGGRGSETPTTEHTEDGRIDADWAEVLQRIVVKITDGFFEVQL
jgi:hypothetical protein